MDPGVRSRLCKARVDTHVYPGARDVPTVLGGGRWRHQGGGAGSRKFEEEPCLCLRVVSRLCVNKQQGIHHLDQPLSQCFYWLIYTHRIILANHHRSFWNFPDCRESRGELLARSHSPRERVKYEGLPPWCDITCLVEVWFPRSPIPREVVKAAVHWS